ncbi:chromosome segregation SMC family protein [Methylobacterium frigidaeris]|uniref:Chromosome partition protein Smc n=1 Tax=Methylobacterium frigidaeris TaxID=2038277 RepID=A0AA37M7T4_9HYPH|nr:AAA family ATPase [Methylobacterium frigidaeris]PIK70227.1 chromosome segregation protein SMC [Methylobacterium frigidaeris]GJD65081.1 Chromosome partition protein Smc [Methylobacterium frigidaeris]
MKFTRLRIVGFKTFVEPSEFLIEPGLTGVIGPNGCGKSNLVEALRWVMGESSHKSMRASGMDDVIFSGSGGRAGRSHAEVTLTLDNGARTAPTAFNAADLLEVSRRIDRGAGSTYQVNGREVRARDVQLMFADAATGARSPAMVRQGQVAELIAAKPQARRRILEDAAGIGGLHARRHEAELRLKAAEENLSRVEDVLTAITAGVDSLRRQARSAQRYRAIAAEIRRHEALLLLIGHTNARRETLAAEAALAQALDRLAAAQAEQVDSATAQGIAAAALPRLREAESAAAAALQRLTLAAAQLEAQERRSAERLRDLGRRIVDLRRDLAREAASRDDAQATRERLDGEAAALIEAEDGEAAREEAVAREAAAETSLAGAEAALAAAQGAQAEHAARRGALIRAAADERARATRLAAEQARLAGETAAHVGSERLNALREAYDAAKEAAEGAEEAAAAARDAVAESRDAEARGRPVLAAAEREAARLDTEALTLTRLVAPGTEARFSPILDAITVEPGYEAALAAALGDDLEAALDPQAPTHWALLPDPGTDPDLPAGARPLAERVTGPPALARRLRQVGLVEPEDAAGLRERLHPGQRLVTKRGDLTRWDGLTAAAEAPQPAARRLSERNRIETLNEAAAEAREQAEAARETHDALQARAREAAAAEIRALDGARLARRNLDGARELLSHAERREAEAAARRVALFEAEARLAADAEEATARAEAAEEALAALDEPGDLTTRLDAARMTAEACRLAAAEARAARLSLTRAAEESAARRAALAADRARWQERAERAEAALDELNDRLAAAEEEQAELAEAPETFAEERRRLTAETDRAEAARAQAGERLIAGETHLAEAETRARDALDAFASARETRAAAAAAHEALTRRLAEVVRAIVDSLETNPEGLYGLAGATPGDPLPEVAAVEAKAAALRADRDRLGAVNLRAEEELRDTEGRRDELGRERDELIEAIRRLRGAIQGLNREGRERLLAAFTAVNGHFERLFTTLFGGGTAELTLVDSDDPLEAGLDILARPPGKKPQTMTLLSGGEQALTATALIFAVFLTNPSPVCVLDEVDAPLDDANVERYCDLLSAMARDTDTRFIVITHNPITMARMDRLFGVTMAERGVSQLVSVDLATAERLVETV